MLLRLFSTAILAAAVLVSGSIKALAEELDIRGSTTVTSNLIIPHKAEIEEKTGLKLKIAAIGSSKGMKALVAGEADMAMISANLPKVLAKVEAPDDGTYIAHKVGETSVSFAVHPENPVKSLTDEQVKDILLGKIRNWKDVGGEDKEIRIVTEYKGGGFRTMVESDFLGKQDIDESMTVSQPNALRIMRVAENMPEAFVVITTGMLKEGKLVEISTEEKVIQPLIFVSKGEPTEAMKKLIDVSKEILAK